MAPALVNLIFCCVFALQMICEPAGFERQGYRIIASTFGAVAVLCFALSWKLPL